VGNCVTAYGLAPSIQFKKVATDAVDAGEASLTASTVVIFMLDCYNGTHSIIWGGDMSLRVIFSEESF
jgi:hypothetical protein